MTTREQVKLALAMLIRLYGVEGVRIYQHLSDEHGPATVARYLGEVIEEYEGVASLSDPRRI